MTPGGGRRAYEWADSARSAAGARELDGISFFRELMAGRLPPPPIAATVGFGWVSVEPGKAVFEITPAEYHYNPIGSVHGGVYATLCDSACGCAVHSLLPAGAYYTSLDLSVRFIRQITSRTGQMLCEGRWSISAHGPPWPPPGSPTPPGSCTRRRPAAA